MKLLCLALLALVPFVCEANTNACASIAGSAQGATGKVCFAQDKYGTDRLVEISGTIQGLPVGSHGFHIHELGDISNGCVSTGGHFEGTMSATHGLPPNLTRHAGDLGNVVADANGNAVVSTTSNVITLCGSRAVIGRTLVVTENEDDGTESYGNAIACGVIGRAAPAP